MLTAIARSLCITSARAGTPVPLCLGITVPCGAQGLGSAEGACLAAVSSSPTMGWEHVVTPIQCYPQGGMCLAWSGAKTLFIFLISLAFVYHFAPTVKLMCCLPILQENHCVKCVVWTAIIPAGFNNLLSKSALMSLVCLHVYGSVNTHIAPNYLLISCGTSHDT